MVHVLAAVLTLRRTAEDYGKVGRTGTAARVRLGKRKFS